MGGRPKKDLKIVIQLEEQLEQKELTINFLI
jgi:hypothetical protein